METVVNSSNRTGTVDLAGQRDAEFAAVLDKLEADMKELRATYELYFMGVERNEPSKQRDAIKRTLRRLQESKPRNTAAKFRLQQMRARMISFENLWNRVTREREAGTYRRDVAKARRREAELAARRAAAKEAVRTDVPTVPPDRAAPARPRARTPEDLTDGQLQKLYQTYVGARRKCGEGIDLRYDEMASTLRKQVPRLRQKTGASAIEFKVVIREGRAILKAIPRHD